MDLILAGGEDYELLWTVSKNKEKDFDFAVRLTKENGIASVPVSAFYNKKNDYKMLRFCFAKTNETLEQAAEKLCSIKADKTIGKITTI